MSKKTKEFLIIISIVLLIIGSYLFFGNFNLLIKGELNIGLIIGFIILLILLISFLIFNLVKAKIRSKEIKNRDKLFNALTINGETVYILYDEANKKVSYISKNASSVLGMDIKDGNEVIEKIFQLPVLQNELKEWNKKSEFVSQMMSYKKEGYQHQSWINVRIYPVNDKKQKYEVILISDVTKEHDRQHMLVTQASDIKYREKQLSQITSSTYDIEIDINLSNNSVKLNNLKPNEYLGPNMESNFEEFEKTINDYIDSKDKSKFLEEFSFDNLNKLYELKTLEPISIRYNLKNDICLESTAFLSIERGEKIVTILTKDVTENAEYIKNQNILLQQSLNETKNANKQKNIFLETMSHDIRTSMNAILGFSESVLNSNIDGEIKDEVENINSASHDMLEIIDEMLDISKIESGVLELHEKNYDSSKLFKELLNVTKKNISKNSNVELNVSKTLPTSLYGDSVKIRQIILNIIDYLKANKKDVNININVDSIESLKDVKLDITIESLEDKLQIKEIENLFKEDNDIGLNKVKKLVDLFKGQIVVENTDKSLKFEIQLMQKISSNIVLKTQKTLSKFEGKKILIVDDNKLDQKVAMRLLRDSKLIIECANSGSECIDLVKENKYDMVLLDQMMPLMDGVETLKHLKSIKGYNTPTIILTADAMAGKKEEYIKAGFDDYLSKPIIIEQLNLILKKYLKED